MLSSEQPSECQGLNTWEIDFQFLQNQMLHPQVGVVGSRDKNLEKREKTRSTKMGEQMKRERIEEEEKKQRFRKARSEEIGDSFVMEENEESTSTDKDPDYVPLKYLRKPKKLDKVMLELPTKDLGKNINELCDRLKLSHASALSLFAKIILSGGGD